MKKLLSLLLVLAMASALWAPALAEEGFAVDGQAAQVISLEDLAAEGFWTVDVDELEPGDPAVIDPGFFVDTPTEEPTFTLVVNGRETDVPLTVTDWVTYTDATALGAALGRDVGTGPVALRAVAEAAGWDVVWYDGGWWSAHQEICLWDRQSILSRWQAALAPGQKLLKWAVKEGMDALWAPQPTLTTQSAQIKLTRFSTLDGNKTYTVHLDQESVTGQGVWDCTLTLDVSQLLGLLTPQEWKDLLGGGDLTLDKLTALTKAGKAELIVDGNAGAVAVNIPALALLDESLAGWQVLTVPGMGQSLDQLAAAVEELDLAQMAYDAMVAASGRSGGSSAWESVGAMVEAVGLYIGPDKLKVSDSGVVDFTIRTEDVNRGMSAVLAALGLEQEQVSLYKRYEIDLHLDPQGKVKMTAAVRPDMEGIAALAAQSGEGPDAALESVALRVLLSLLDMELTGQAQGTAKQYTESARLHWNNMGTLEAAETTTVRTASKPPRQVGDLTAANTVDLTEFIPDPLVSGGLGALLTGQTE